MTSPDANRMRALFADPTFRFVAWRKIIGGELVAMAERDVHRAIDDTDIHAEYEVDGWDVCLAMSPWLREATSPWLRNVYLRLEPAVGDDFPEILRDMKARFAPTFGEWRALVMDRFNAEGAGFVDVRRISSRMTSTCGRWQISRKCPRPVSR